MNMKFLSVIAITFLPIVANGALPFVGLYQTIDDETNLPKSVVQLYQYQDGDDTELAGRIVALYGTDGTISETIAKPVRVADAVKGAPQMVGLDIIWAMEWDEKENKFEDGKIMDPKSGKIYSSVIWQDTPNVLSVRGKIGPFGRTQKWNEINTNDLPAELQNIDTSTWNPVIHK